MLRFRYKKRDVSKKLSFIFYAPQVAIDFINYTDACWKSEVCFVMVNSEF